MDTRERFTVLVMASCLLFACADEPQRSNASDDTPSPEGSAAQTASAPRNACELLTAEEVTAVHGEPVDARAGEENDPDQSSCVYAVPGSEWEVMWLTVTWRGGIEEWNTQQTGRAIGTRMMSPEGVAVDSLTRPDTLSGIGDVAYYGGILPSLVLKGDVLIEFMMPLLRDDRENFPALARSAVSRL
jgi:hypothetical protein